MKFFKFYFDIGYYTGTGTNELYVAYEDNIQLFQVEIDCMEAFYEYADSYQHLILNGYDEEDDDEHRDVEEYLQDYYEDYCNWNFEEITEEEYKQAIKEGYDYK